MKRIHQDLGFIDLAGNKSGEVVRVYLPADANCLLAVAQEALQETYVCNIILLREIGAMAARLGGVDVLAFTGGIGEHDDAPPLPFPADRESMCPARPTLIGVSP